MTARVLTIGIFASCWVLLIVVGLVSRVGSGRVATPSHVFARLLAHRATRVAVALAWAWVGWHFLVTPPK